MIEEIRRQEELAGKASTKTNEFAQDIENTTERLLAFRKTLALVKEEKRSLAEVEQKHLQRLEEQDREKARLLKEREELHLSLEKVKQALQVEEQRAENNNSMVS